jgi:threonylcarbamoyladenosine tRNA methylthiotransferase MtaB
MPQLDRALIKQRAADLRADVAKTREEWMQTLVGSRLSVLTETDGTGYSQNFARVAVPAGTAEGSILTITPQASKEGLLT